MRPKIHETPQQWYDCLEAGTAAVRQPYKLRQSRLHGLPKLTVFHIASFQDCFGWTVYKARGEADYKLQTVIWKQVSDSQRIQELIHGRVATASAEPTIVESISRIPAQRFDQLLTGLAAIRIPLLTKRTLGCDGEIFGLSVRGEFEVEWWCDGPPEWADLSRWTHECIKLLRGTVVT